jgi:hypothetical protein
VSFEVLVPYYLEDNKDAAGTVTSERYVEMFRNFCESELRGCGIDLSSVWFQQEGAISHTEMASMSVLREYFHNTSSLVAVIFHGLFVHL